MRVVTVRVTRKVAEISEKILLQIVVSVAATVCVAMISNAYLKSDAPPVQVSETAAFALDARSAAGLFDAHFQSDTFRVPVASPIEFGALFGPSIERAALPIVGEPWSVASHPPEQAAERPALQKARTTIAATVLPPARPAFERPDPMTAQATVFAPEAEPERRLAILGIAMPRFVPTGEKIVSSVTALGASLTDLVLR
ncbi:hypothetical protein [Microvirga antarctica]|uniref:hypothetical protein n=1 Tax=Microvirga antarctica TaxID=2819233 RepID=UPI001B318871|nr:hypothetical protein [Microvirga antarctica]